MKKFSEDIQSRLSGRHLKSLRLAKPFKDKVILNIGTWNGWLEKEALNCRAKKVFGLDVKKENLQNAKKEAPEAIFFEGSVTKIPFENDKFDLVCFFEVLEHLLKNQEIAALKEIKRVLKPNGTLIMSTPNSHPLNNIFDPAWYLGHRHYKKSEVKTILEKSGFKVKGLEIKGGAFQIITLNLFYIFKWLFKREFPFKKHLNKKRETEYLSNKKGFVTIFAKASPLL